MYMKKCADSINLVMVAGALVGLIAVYIGFTFLKKGIREGLSDGPYTVNDELIKKQKIAEDRIKNTLSPLKDTPQAYIELLNSYKNLKLAMGIKDLATTKTTTNLTTINDYDEAIRYLQNIGVSNTATEDTTITTTIAEKNSATTLILNELTADNQAYIDLLTSYKKYKMANMIKTNVSANPNINFFVTTANTTPSDYDDSIQYLNELSGNAISPEDPPPIMSTPNISLARK